MNKRFTSLMAIALILAAITMPCVSADLFKGGISGKVTTSDGEAVSGCTITATRGKKNFITTTDASGIFTMKVPPGRYNLKYTFNNKTHTYGSVIVADGLTVLVNIQIPIEGETTPSELRFLEIIAPKTAEVDEEEVIKVIERKSGVPVEAVDMYISDAGIAIGKTEASAVIEYGEHIGETNATGEIKYSFNRTGKYAIAASKGGYIPDVDFVFVRSKGRVEIEPPREIPLPGRNAQLNVSANSIINYTMGGTKIIKSMDTGANITVGAKTGVKTEFQSANLSISAHDNANGLLKFKAKSDTEVRINLSANATIESESKKNVTVKADNVETTFMIPGQGNLTVEDNRTIKANLKANSLLIIKSYPGGKEKSDDEIENGIVNGNISAEVQIFNETEGTTNDTAEYSPVVTIKGIKTTKRKISVTADSITETGTTIVIIVENSMLPADVNNLSIKVDGEDTARASSFAELYATRKEDKPRSMVIKGETYTKILVAMNHFSERTITIESKEVSTAEETPVPSPTTPAPEEIPGFDALTAIAIILTVYLLRGGVKMRSKRR